MKIAFIGQKGIPAKSSGIEGHVEEIATKLAKNGHEVFVYSQDEYTERNMQKYEGVNIVHLAEFLGKNFHGTLAHNFFSTIHSIFCRYDVIHYHSEEWSMLPVFIKLFKPKTALVSTYHGWNNYHSRKRLLSRLNPHLGEKISFSASDKAIAVSSEIAKKAPQKSLEKLSVIPDGIKIEEENASEDLEKWKLLKNGYVICLSPLIRSKGIHFIIDAYRNLESKSMTRRKKLVIVEDSFSDKEYVKELRLNAALSENIIFTGPQEEKTISQLLSNAYLFIESSQKDEISPNLLRAMSYGKAALVSNTPSNLEIANPGAGIAFQNGDVYDLENKLVYMINNPVLIREMGERGRQKISEKFSWERIAVKLENLYNQIIREKRNGRFNQI